jgi:hypothetical protein
MPPLSRNHPVQADIIIAGPSPADRNRSDSERALQAGQAAVRARPDGSPLLRQQPTSDVRFGGSNSADERPLTDLGDRGSRSADRVA